VTDVLWLRPPKGDHLSVGRHRIADELGTRGFTVTVRDVTRSTASEVLRDGPRADIIVGTTRAGAIVGTLAKLRFGTPLIVDHIDPIRQFHAVSPPWLSVPVHCAESLTFHLADHVCWVTKDDSPRVRRWGQAMTRTTLGVPFDQFATPSTSVVSKADRRLADYDLNNRVAVYVGGLEPVYNIDALLDGVERAEGWTLVVLGDGSQATDVEAAVASRADVIYLGSVPHDEVPGYLRIADVAINLADERTVKVIEYAAAGLPVVHVAGSAANRFGELVKHTTLEPRRIAGALDEAIAWPQKFIDEMQRYAQQRDWGKVATAYEEAIHLSLNQPRLNPTANKPQPTTSK